MRELLNRTAALSPQDTVPGPERLAVGYLRASAKAYLGAQGGRP